MFWRDLKDTLDIAVAAVVAAAVVVLVELVKDAGVAVESQGAIKGGVYIVIL